MKFYVLDTYNADFLNEFPPRRGEVHEIVTDEGDTVAYGGSPKYSDRVCAALQACHGLDLPANVSPGALAEIVTAARAVSRIGDDLRGIPPGEELDALLSALAKLDPPPAEPKPYAYAVKTANGYVANQGDQWWHESDPVGWALLGTREAAERIACLSGGKVVPVFKR